jgi:hypothetical protein
MNEHDSLVKARAMLGVVTTKTIAAIKATDPAIAPSGLTSSHEEAMRGVVERADEVG